MAEPQPTPQPTPQPEPRRWFPAALATLLTLAAALTSVRPFRESDLFWHLALGRAVLRAHARVVPEPCALEAFSRTSVAQEWLWEVLLYGLFRAFSYAAIAALVVAIGGALGATVPWMLRLRPRRTPERDAWPGDAALALVAPIVLMLALSRVRERPESLGLLLLVAFVGLARRYAASDTPDTQDTPGTATRLAAALVGVELIWAQTHPTFVLAPAIFLAALGARPLAALRAALRRHGAVLAALSVGLLTSAHGLGIFANLSAHAHGDAVAHITDMAAPTWQTFHPLESVFGPLYALGWLLGLGGALLARRVRRDSLLLATLGLVLVSTAVRGLAPGGVLLGPLAFEGARAIAEALPLRRARLLVGAFGVLGALLFVRAAVRLHEQNGPIGRIGPVAGWFPLGGAARLAQGPTGARVLTTFDSGAAIGFLGDGRARVTLDSRVPLQFDDTELAIMRDALGEAGALKLALARYAADVAVVSREGAACGLLAGLEGWDAVLTEPRYTTFARAGTAFGGRRLLGVAPCGADYLARRACEEPRALEDDLAELARFDDASFVGFLRAESAVRCLGPRVELAQVAKLVPSSWEAYAYAWPRDALLARLLVRAGQGEAALDLLEPWLDKQPLGAVSAIGPLVANAREGGELRRFLARAVARLADDAPADLEADLAWLCALDREAECARFHAARAALRGSARAGRALCWVAHEHRDAKARDDARAWLDTRKRLGVPEASGDCPP